MPAGSPRRSTNSRACGSIPAATIAPRTRRHARLGPRSSPRSPTCTAASPPCTGPGSLATGRARRRSKTRVARSATSSGRAYASGSSMTSSRSAKASRPCCRSGASSLGCPMIAGLSANHLAALELPFGLRRLYVARDNDAEGRRAETRLRERFRTSGRRCLRFAAGLCGL